jgi:hypothetical protein
MDQNTEILFLTLKSTETKSIRPNDVSLLGSLRRQGLLVEKYVADDLKALKQIALVFMSSKNTSRFVVFSSDQELYEISRSNLTIEQKKSILPVGKASAFRMPGSKVGFIEFCMKNSIPHPLTRVVKSKKQLNDLERYLVYPIILKGDTGAGGESVFRVTHKMQLLDYFNRNLSFPLIIQENIESQLYSVEAFFKFGHLCGWMFSEVIESVSEFGGSIARKYLLPQDDSFIDILCEFGKSAEIHGFVNCGFFHSKERGYLLFEADLRPNAWHHLFDTFGMDIKSVFRNEASEVNQEPLYPKNLPVNGVPVRLAHRELTHALDSKQYGKYFFLCISYVFGSTYIKTPEIVNKKMYLSVFLKSMLLLLVKMSYAYLPGRVREWSGMRKIPIRVIRRFLSY